MAEVSLLRALGASARSKSVLSSVPGSGRGWFPWVSEPYAGAWQRDDELKVKDVLCSPIVYACITLIANDIGKLRARLVDKDKNGIWSEVETTSPYWLPLRKPNRYQNHIQFKQWWMMSKLRFGNTYALKERDNAKRVVRLYVLDPCRVTPMVSDDGSVFYQLSQDNLAGVPEASITVPASEIIHDRMNCLYHPLCGISPLYAAAIAAGIGIKIQRNVASFFGNSSTPSGILIAPGNITPENAKNVKEAWDAGYSGINSGKVAVIGDGMKFEPMSQKATDSQLIETMQWSDERICSVFHVPAYKVGVGDTPSYNNIEALDRAYYSSCLQTPIEEMEACLDDGLGLDGVTRGVDLDLDGLMRMDSKTQMETIGEGIQAKAYTINDGRKKLNLPPIDGGDTVYMQLQDLPISEVKDNKIPSAQGEAAPASQPSEQPAQDAQPSPEDQARAMTAQIVKALQDGLAA
ncbi:phage portal protein [Delftia tsuruhatensis]|uniref:Phage portal protein n=2 Tax=Delftia tsuruhatensis TaxID=180282 RepID=A0ABN4SDP4_9BURK|nr:phage portal protein [Delftia tsuruhatensis]AOV01690.1 phage portal protein [Delftia tsuruhatensis]